MTMQEVGKGEWYSRGSMSCLEHSRSLPTDVKQELKAAVLRRTVATIRQYEAIKREFDAKAMLFERRLIADVHWQSVKAEYEDICAQLKLIMYVFLISFCLRGYILPFSAMMQIAWKTTGVHVSCGAFCNQLLTNCICRP